MKQYIDVNKLKVLLSDLKEDHKHCIHDFDEGVVYTVNVIEEEIIDSLQQEQPDSMIQWAGNNLKEVIDFTGKSPMSGEWFKSFEEYENYVHTHNDILKLFCEDGSHYEVPAGAWIVKTPDGHNVPSVAKYVQQEQPEVGKYDCPTTPIEEAVEVTSRMQHIDEEMKPIAKFIMDYASWNLHKDEWNQPVIEVPLFRVLDALVQKGKPYCCAG